MKAERSDWIIEIKVHVDPVALALDGSPFRTGEFTSGATLLIDATTALRAPIGLGTKSGGISSTPLAAAGMS